MARWLPVPRRWLMWISLGLFLRLLFIVFPRPVDDDTWDYLELGRNLLQHGIYGMGVAPNISQSLFRLPGYPLFLATCEAIFGHLLHGAWFNAVFVIQAFADLAAGVLLAAFARRDLSPRAAEITLALAMLCPFTAAYAGIAMTECLSVFAVALALYASSRALGSELRGARDSWALLLAGLAAALGMLLRPDGVVLFAVLAAGLFGYTFRVHAARAGTRSAVRRAVVATGFFLAAALLPMSPWTIRNWTAFHVFQPLAPRHLEDPGERANLGFYRWLRTWSEEYVTTADVFWAVGTDPIDFDHLPPRAIDSPEERAQTLQLISEYNLKKSISAELDQRFAALAEERIRANPLRYYIELPLVRVTDMIFRPRTEEFYLDVYWWQWSNHPSQTMWATLLGVINLFYVVCAVWAFARGRVPWAWILGGYLLLRCLLLGTMENPEPRYTIMCFPIFIIATAAALGRTVKTKTMTEPLQTDSRALADESTSFHRLVR